MQPPRNTWPAGPAADHALFIAQLFREMLGPNTYESFRVTSLDLFARLAEVHAICDDIQSEKVKFAALIPALEELKHSLANDKVISDICPREVVYLRSNWLPNNIVEKDINSLVRYIRTFWSRSKGDYRTGLERNIVKSSANPERKEHIRQLVTSYCSHLINIGYSRQFIYSETEKRFFKKDIKKIERRTIESFFKIFDERRKSFSITIPISDAFSAYISSLNRFMLATKSHSQLSPDVQVAFEALPNYRAGRKYVVGSVSAVDEYSAAREMTEALESLIAMTYLNRRGVELEWESKVYAKRSRGLNGSIIKVDQVVLQTRQKHLSGRVLRELQSQADQIMTKFDDASTDRLISAVNMSAISRSSYRPENQLITLWSAVEVLIDDPRPGTARINHYIEALIPAICIKYPRRYIIAVFDNLIKYNRSHVVSFLRREEFNPADDQYTKFTKLIFRDDFKYLHLEFCAGLHRNPLALYRLWKLEKNFDTPHALLKSIEEHEQRVRWQVARIYRTRNNIVHSGQLPTFLVPLVINVFEYFRSALVPVLTRASSSEMRGNIDQIVSEIGFDYQMIKEELRSLGTARFDIEGVAKYLR